MFYDFFLAFPSRIFPPSALSMDAELEDWVLEAGDLITARHLGSMYTNTSFTTRWWFPHIFKSCSPPNVWTYDPIWLAYTFQLGWLKPRSKQTTSQRQAEQMNLLFHRAAASQEAVWVKHRRGYVMPTLSYTNWAVLSDEKRIASWDEAKSMEHTRWASTTLYS